MAKITGIDAIQDAMEQYGVQGADFFGLKDNGDQDKVRILHKDDDDLDIYAVHKVLVGGKERYVDCLNSGSDPKPCAFCERGNKVTLKVILTLFVHSSKKVKIWERGKDMIKILTGLIATYGAPLYNRDFVIIRNGKANSVDTVYNVNGIDRDTDPAVTAEYQKMCEERTPICSPDGFVLEKTYDEQIDLITLGALGTTTTTTAQGSSTTKKLF